MSRRSVLGLVFGAKILLAISLVFPVRAQQSGTNSGSKPLRDVLDRPPGSRIIGGGGVTFAMNPWQVALVAAKRPMNRDAQFCGGSIVAARWVLTAAHCVDQGTSADQVAILTGTASLLDGGKRVKVEPDGIIVHEKWNIIPHDSDVALIRVDSDLNGQPISGPGDEAQEPQDGQLIRVTGWGALAYHQAPGVLILQGTELPYVNRTTCNLPVSYDHRVTVNMICAGYKDGGTDACTGDSGGPATTIVESSRRLIGIISWAIGCGFPKYYSVYTRVSQFRSWIREKSGGDVGW